MYINKTTEEFPLYEGDIRLQYPDMGEVFELPEGFSEVLSSPVPELLEGKKAIQDKPIINSDGQYEQVFIIESLTGEELENKAKMRSIYEKI